MLKLFNLFWLRIFFYLCTQGYLLRVDSERVFKPEIEDKKIGEVGGFLMRLAVKIEVDKDLIY